MLKGTGSGGRMEAGSHPLGSRAAPGLLESPQHGEREGEWLEGARQEGASAQGTRGGLWRRHALRRVGPGEAPESAETGGQASWPWRCRPWGGRAGEKGPGHGATSL